MPLPARRSVLIISGLLTLLVLGGGTLAVGFHNGSLRTTSNSPSREIAAVSAQPTPTGSDRDEVARLTEPSPAPSTQGAMQDEVGVYRQKLDEAYRALDDAIRRSARCNRRSPSSPRPAVTMTGSGSTIVMTIVVGADLTDAVHTTTHGCPRTVKDVVSATRAAR
jgi:hypothetical protein